MLAKRLTDIVVAAIGLLLLGPVLAAVAFAIWVEDRHSPIYTAQRVGVGGATFKMKKFRSMVVGADRTGVTSTGARDSRITKTGQFVRRYKLDELPQLWNVLIGEMSLVGPRPQVLRDAALYTTVEQGLFRVSPGITDIASIVFADEGEILRDSEDPDLRYNQIIRPWKSRLGLLYVKRRTMSVDIALIALTVCAVFSRRWTLNQLSSLLKRIGAPEELQRVARRTEPLQAYPPPGASRIVASV